MAGRLPKRVHFGIDVERRGDGAWTWEHDNDTFEMADAGLIYVTTGGEIRTMIGSAPDLKCAVAWTIGFCAGKRAGAKMQRESAGGEKAGSS